MSTLIKYIISLKKSPNTHVKNWSTSTISDFIYLIFITVDKINVKSFILYL